MKKADSSNLSPLQAIPPKTQPSITDLKTIPDQKETASPETESLKSTGVPRVIWIGTIALGLAALSYLSIPNYVTGEAEITSRDRARTKLTMPETGIVNIKIDNHARVYPGQIIAEIVSLELDDKLADSLRSREQAQGQLTRARENLKIAEAQLATANTEEKMSRSRAEEREKELRSLLSQGIPESRSIEREKEGIDQEILAIENEILASKNQIEGLSQNSQRIDNQIQDIHQQVNLYQNLANQGIHARHSSQILDRKNQIGNLEREKGEYQTQQKMLAHQIHRLQATIQQKRKQIEERNEQISLVQKQIQERLQEIQRDVNLKLTQKQSFQKRVEAASSEIITLKQALEQWNHEITRLQERRNALKLISKNSGTVITKNLDLKNNTTLQKGEEILSIANLKQLTAKVQIQQEDLSLVKRNQPVNFKLQDGGAGKYRANVNKISPIIQSDTPGAAPMATIEILIDNEDNRLLLEGKGYAHIQTNKMRIHQKIGHELGKLFDFGRFLPWL